MISHNAATWFICLNRTSVGLKRESMGAARCYPMEPQSNQRGIETAFIAIQGGLDGDASIEPAWD